MLTKVIVTVAIISNFSAANAQSVPPASATIQAEAERDLKQNDCQIVGLQKDIENLQVSLKNLVVRQSALWDERSEFIEEKLAKYDEEWDVDVLDEFEFGSKADVDKAAGKLFSRINAIESVISDWQGVMDKAQDVLSLNDKNIEIERSSADFVELRRQINATNPAIKSLFKLHDTKVAQWESRGVRFQRPFYGTHADCGIAFSTFDGSWAYEGSDKNTPYFEARGTAIKMLLPPDRVEFHIDTPCTPTASDLRYTSATTATFEYRMVCTKGGPGGNAVVNLFYSEGEVSQQVCNWDAGTSKPACIPSLDEAGLPLLKTSL